MWPAIKSELRKLLTVRSTYFTILIALGLIMLFAFYGEGLRSTAVSANDPGKLANDVVQGVLTVGLIGGLVGMLLFSHEYRYNTIMYTLTATNRRTKVLLAKIIVASVFAAGFALAMGALSPAVTYLGMKLHGGLVIAHPQLDIFSLAWRSAFVGWGFSMLGMIIVTLLRSQVGAIVLYFLFPFTVEQLAGFVIKDNREYLPFNAVSQVLDHHVVLTSDGRAPHIFMSYGHAAIVALIYVVAAWLIAWVLFLRRDAN
jgi:ABC-2 type transport system permease protein